MPDPDAGETSNAPRRGRRRPRSPVPADSVAPGRGAAADHWWPLSTTASDSNPPQWGRLRLRSPVPAAPGRASADDPPRHEERPLSTDASDSDDAPPGWDCRPPPRSPVSLAPARAASDSDSPPGGDSSAAWDQGVWRPRSPADPFAPEYFDMLAGYFVEAASRLPLAEIPYLARCIKLSAISIGLADPVTNIILTTIDTFARTEPYMLRLANHTTVEQTKHKLTFADRSRCSYVYLHRFLLTYFQHLRSPQADLLLKMSGYDLRIAIEAVQSYVGGSLLPDSARTKSAFEEAAYPKSAGASDLLRLTTSSYPCCMVEPVLEDLRRGGKLAAACIYKLCKLLRNPWSPPPSRPPPPTPGTFRNSSGGLIHIVCFGDDSFLTTHISKDGIPTSTFTKSPPNDAGLSEDTTNWLGMFPIHSHEEICSVTLETPEFLSFLRFQLLDMVHGVYLKALAMLPERALREGHLLHSLVTAGHCYGPLDPVGNIVMNTIWYHALFPLSNEVASKLAAADILNARAMHRVESRSIDGLVAYLRRCPSTDEQKAVTLLCKNRLDTPFVDLSSMCDVAQAAKHPQPAAFGEFLESESITELYKLYCHARVDGDPDSAFERIRMALLQSTRVAPGQRCPQAAPITSLEILSARRSTFIFQQAQIRGVLEHLLMCFGYNDPLAPPYKLGVICGVTRQRNYSYTDVHHANFLASSDGGSSWKLFFAEFWSHPDDRIEESGKPFCCLIPDDQGYPGRCVVCEYDSSIIFHPESRKYYMGNSTLPFPLTVHLGADVELDFDIIYSESIEGGGGAVCGYSKLGGGNDSVLGVLQPVECLS